MLNSVSGTNDTRTETNQSSCRIRQVRLGNEIPIARAIVINPVFKPRPIVRATISGSTSTPCCRISNTPSTVLKPKTPGTIGITPGIEKTICGHPFFRENTAARIPAVNAPKKLAKARVAHISSVRTLTMLASPATTKQMPRCFQETLNMAPKPKAATPEKKAVSKR